jgi:demethylmenaquinone methyltransferase / 2-methoxy-6-polyprenyl-1,4-benzoquinol methylase
VPWNAVLRRRGAGRREGKTNTPRVTTTQKQPSLPGSRPQGVRDESEAAARVRDMFARIAPRYDLLNHLLSFSFDHVWRRRTATRFLDILGRPQARILDLCCGTGDLAFALDRARRSTLDELQAARAPIFGSDFVEPMLTRARKKAGHRAVVFAGADALHLPFPDASFDLVATAFGFRNLANYEEGLHECARVLKQGGEVGILEFTEPSSGPMASLFRFYFKNILPRIGAAVSGNSEAYAYLPKSVSNFPPPSELSVLLEKSGFCDVRLASWNFGSVTLCSARRA